MTRSTQNCLLRHFDNPTLCLPLNPAFIGLHGTNGKGGRVANAGTPLDYTGLLLADSPARDGQAKIYEKLGIYAKSFDKQFADVQAELFDAGKTENEIRIKSLYLWSESPGTGKTTSAVAVMNEYLVKHFVGNLLRGAQPKQRPVFFLDVNEWQTQYNSFNRPRVPDDIAEPAARRYYKAMELARLTDFVVLDDIGVRENVTDAFRGDLHAIINHRVTNQLPTIYTSNIPIAELPEVFGEQRLADRVRDMTQEIHFDGKSARGTRK